MNPCIRRIQHAVLIATIAMTTTAYAEHPYENDIRDFEIADRANPPPANAVLFVGSSTIRLWPDVQPRRDLYDADGLHMSKAGYALWREILRPYVR